MEIRLRTNEKIEIIDITEKVEEVVRNSRVNEGICLLYVPHATAGLILNENEKGLKEDIKKFIQDVFFNRDYKHNLIDDNGASHLASSFIGHEKVIPINNGRLLRGTWQNVLFVELDGPRDVRKVIVWILKKK